MVSNKHIIKIAVALTAVAVILCYAAMLLPFKTDTAYSMEYRDKLFDTSEIIDINIIMDNDTWQEMLDNAMSEQYYKCDVVINDTTFYSVGIRPKGNTSLSSIAMDPDNNRYSFKLEFDKFVDGQTCFGLDKLVLNNNFADATNMKEAIIYDMYQFIGADASLYNYAKISVNDSYWGVYLALEAVEDSFMLRNYGTEMGKLYKPDSMNMGGRGDKNQNDFGGKPPEFNMEEMPKPPEDFDFEQMQSPPEGFDRGGKGGFPGGFGSNGSNLNYTDDSFDSYSAIWEGSVNGTTEADKSRVVKALKNASANAEKYLDVDNMLKYMTVHSFAVNEDSLSGGMAHNYYLYEANGRLNIIPWDYNLAWGGMGGMGNRGGGAEGVVNDAIDDSYSSTTLFDVFLNNAQYLEQYHTYYKQLIEGYVESGRFEETYNRIVNQIDELVKTDPNAMYSYDQYVAAKDILYNLITLRAESVKGQLSGRIATTTEGQNNNPDTLVKAEGLDLSEMGSMGGGFGRGNRESGEEK